MDLPHVTNPRVYRYTKHRKTDEWAAGFVAAVEVKIKKYMNGLWQLTIFFDNPVEITDHWSSVLASVNDFSKLIGPKFPPANLFPRLFRLPGDEEPEDEVAHPPFLPKQGGYHQRHMHKHNSMSSLATQA